MVFEENLVVVIECRVGVEFAIVDPKVETHVIKDVAGFVVYFFLGCGKSINEPIERIVLANPLVDKLGVFWRDICHSAQLFADTTVLEHFYLRERQQCHRRQEQWTHFEGRIEYPIAEEDGPKSLRLCLRAAFWLTEVERRVVVVIWSKTVSGAKRRRFRARTVNEGFLRTVSTATRVDIAREHTSFACSSLASIGVNAFTSRSTFSPGW